MSKETWDRCAKEVDVEKVKTTRHMLIDVHDESVAADDKNSAALCRTMAKFASLQVRLGQEQEKCNRTIKRLTAAMLVLTVVIAWLTWEMVKRETVKVQQDTNQNHKTE